jgi:flavin-dependent dehydrogenase
LLNCSSAHVGELELICGRQRLLLPLPAGKAINRATFDSKLLHSAASADVVILNGFPATVKPEVHGNVRIVTISHRGHRTAFSGRVVVVADGLARSSMRHLPEFAASIKFNSRVGVGATIYDAAESLPGERIMMVVSRHAYVGISRVDEHRVNVAAAIAPFNLSTVTPAEAVARILATASVVAPDKLRAATWRGTPALTSRPRRVAGDRIFLIGDAGGYVEPFTGEGMAAAIESALAVTPLVVRGAREWNTALPAAWEATHRRVVRDRQHTSRRLSWALRRPWATAASIGVCRMLPSLATSIIAKTNATSNLELSHFVGTS